MLNDLAAELIDRATPHTQEPNTMANSNYQSRSLDDIGRILRATHQGDRGFEVIELHREGDQGVMVLRSLKSNKRYVVGVEEQEVEEAPADASAAVS